MKTKPNIKILFVDIDNTLYDHNLDIFTPSAIEAIKLARSNGIKVFACTARPYSSILWLGTFNHFEFDGYIANSGGLVYCDNKYILKGNIPEDTVRYVIDIANKNGVCLEICNEHTSFTNMKEDECATRFHGMWKQADTKPGVYNGGDINSIIVYGYEEVDKYFDKVNDMGAKFFRFCPIACDIFEYRYQKSHGVKAVLDYFGYSKDDALAIGDDNQDLEMFEEVSYKVAMGNGVEALKQEATYITSDINDDGVYNALKHYEII